MTTEPRREDAVEHALRLALRLALLVLVLAGIWWLLVGLGLRGSLSGFMR